ncbi:Eukaryotic translation initiation factor 3 subunit A [Meloidogyne graminicola]|uniref:Eukaryotic translation initiation factor 3 subunit A n=1 Tax=Meloidogyne graminicola TaxID=189291 RepID=A0A8T0A0J4_9BILA|nr:Eukaryotic translation initiation factor 3 subunit A [Meloidogyne graminicola]
MRSSYQSHKPEAALQRAHEFISVGKQKDALQSLHDLIKGRRQKQWSQIYEQIMLKYVELCVNLRNSSMAKDGLYQYKLLTQQVAVKSLENVIESFLSLAEQKTLEAQKSSIEKVEEIDDLDVGDAPENLLLSFVSGAVPQDRMDRTVLSPWLRFQWDTFRNCLDLLRNNVYVEQIYHQIARQSFAFCLKYQRRNEFRKLSDMLRLHLTQIQKTQLAQTIPAHAIKLTNIESLSLMLETRLCQLDTAINMELWQEAYKSAEDLHNLMQIGKDKDKKIVKPASYVNYYDKIALVFWKGGNTLFHAASLLQKFNIYKDMKKQFTGEEASDQATRVLLATLSIPDGAENPSILTKHLDIEEQHIANTRILSALLRMPVIPTRQGILKEIARLNIPEISATEAYNLYKCIETDFDHLHIATYVQQLLLELEKLGNSEYNQYSDSIKQSVAAKVVKQISSIYDSITIERLSELIPFYNRMQMEQFLVDICKQHSVSAHIDHRQNCIYFGPEDSILASELESEHGTVSEISKIKMHVSSIYSRLQDVYLDIDQSSVKELQNKLSRQIKIYLNHKDGDFERILARRKKIEHYKENTEQIRQEKLIQAQALANKQEEKRRTEEYKKLLEENKENEQRRKAAEQEEIKRKVAAERLLKHKSHPLYESLVKEFGEEELEKMDLEQFIKEKRLLLEKERKEQQNKMLQQEKKYDYNVRALHLEEMLVWKQLSEENRSSGPELFDQYETKRIDEEIKAREKSIETFQLLTSVKEDAIKFMRSTIQSHAEELKTHKEQWMKKVELVREEAIKQMAMERMKKWQIDVERQKRLEEEQRRKEEEERRNEEKKKKEEALLQRRQEELLALRKEFPSQPSKEGTPQQQRRQELTPPQPQRQQQQQILMRYYYQNHKPEAALQRAHEFISVGKQKDALQSLHDLIKGRRQKQWSQIYEQIMLKYVELCVNLRNSSMAKDGLYQYKLLTQQVAVKSLENVIESFLSLAEQKTLEAQKSSIEKVEEIDDLDVADAPENLLLSFVSGAVPQDRMDRTVLSPWLRFQWDTFRNCLDLLRNNVYVEQIYHKIARRSFAFCLKYQRRNEFRKLSDMLRLHLTQIQKTQLAQSIPAHAIILTNIESLSLMLETRLCQLDTAINMEVWQEAYKSAEDLHNLMQMGKDKDKKIVKPSSCVNYYNKTRSGQKRGEHSAYAIGISSNIIKNCISLVFWKGGNTLFHAASLLQKFNIYKDMKKQFTGEEASDQATRVLLATLSIPDGAENPSILTKHLDIEEQHIANTRILSALLRMPVIPMRQGILKEIARLNIPEISATEAYNLYKCIETDFDHLHIATYVQQLLLELEKLGNSEYNQYSDSIKQSVAAKVVKQISSIYDSITIERLSELIPFYNRMQMEQFLVDICKQHSVSAHIDHRQNCIYFGPEDSILASELESEHGTVSEISKIKMHVSSIYSRLQDVYLDIDQSFFKELQNKENTEQIRQEKLIQAQALANKQEEKRRTEEYKKLLEENKENEQRRKAAEQEEIKRKVAAERLLKHKSHPLYESLVKEFGEEELEKMDLEQFIKEKRLLLEKERKEQQNKMLQQEKKYDYNVRALHLEEMLVWKQLSEKSQSFGS